MNNKLSSYDLLPMKSSASLRVILALSKMQCIRIRSPTLTHVVQAIFWAFIRAHSQILLNVREDQLLLNNYVKNFLVSNCS